VRFILILVSAFLAGIATAAVPEETPILQLNLVDTGVQINPHVAALPNNHFAMVYEDRAGNDGS